METDISPTPNDINLVRAFKIYNEIQAGIKTSVRPKEEQFTNVVEVQRNGWIGKLLDKLLGKKKQVVTKTVNKYGISYMNLQLVQLIESVKNDVRQNKIEEAQNNASGY